VFTWTGCYIGANAGGGWAEKNFTFSDSSGTFDEGRHTADGGAVGGQVGCDYQSASNWVIGIRGMWDWSNLKGSNAIPDDTDDTYFTKVRSFATIDARLGFLVNPTLLLYGKGGVAFVNENHSFTSTDEIPAFASASTGNFTRTGWDAGVGLEWRYAPNWSLWVEYAYMGFGTASKTFVYAGGSSFQEDIKQNLQTVLVGINYRFDMGKAPVAAKY
jgi:outer membrane immunogenic protein